MNYKFLLVFLVVVTPHLYLSWVCTDSNCLECQTDKDTCNKCKLNYFLLSGKCENYCSTTSCIDCLIKISNGERICRECKKGYSLQPGI